MTMDNDKKLPIAIISPHGGLGILEELNGRVALSPEQIFNEADAYVDDIFNFKDRVLYYETFPYGRCIFDLNRPADATFHHRQGDGVIKQQTSYGDPVFYEGKMPDNVLEEHLINKYWQPWHNKLDQIAKDKRVKLVLDCHTMAATGPVLYDDPYHLRPRITVSNMGDTNGSFRPKLEFVTAPAELTCWFAHELGTIMADVEPIVATAELSAVNDPYWGGWDIWAHGGKHQPWLMVEVSRALYIGHQTADSPIVPPNQERIEKIRSRVWQGILKLVARLEEK